MSLAHTFARLLALCLLLAPGGAVAAEAASDEPFDPFAASTLHVGGGVQFSWAQTSVGGTAADPVIAFQLEGEVGYFPVDGLKLSGLPLMTVTGQDGVTTVLVGAGAGISYYLPVGTASVFARARGGLLIGTTKADDTVEASSAVEQDLTGFFYGGGLGFALPIDNNVVELGVEYQGANLAVDGDQGEQEGEKHGIYVALGYVMAF